MQRVPTTLAVVAGLAGIVALAQVGQPDAGFSPQGPVLADIHDLSPRELRAGGFVLTSPQDVQVEAIGAERDNSSAFGRFLKNGVFSGRETVDPDRDLWPANAWIVDLATRQVVWELRQSETRRDDGLRAFRGTVRLPAGSYAVYYASYVADWMRTESDGRAIGDRETRREYGGHYVDDDSYRRFRISVHGAGHAMSDAELAQSRTASAKNPVVTLKGDSADQSAHIGFSLDKPVALEVVSIGEAREDGAFDYGYIINTATHKRVWELTYDRSDAAGGSYKNRIARETVTLLAGRYAAFYVTDDTHDPSDWNAAPPYDPDDWGLTIRVANAQDRAAVHTFAYDPAPAGEPIVQMVRLGNDETRSEGFTLTQPLDVRVYALGEADNGDETMADYGWIMSVSTHRRVWTMDYDGTEHAGGAQKNRVFDGTVHLEAGSYIVYYRTDGSHAYGDWNAARPIDPEHWGITLIPASGKVDHNIVKSYSTQPDATVLAQLVKVRNGEQRRRTFRLDRDADVRVYALGEGVGGEMADYAWIENASGNIVWEMRYGTTERAGGARKNRVFDGTVHLAAGQYTVFYKTDDSHAYNDWNDAPPDDPASWGVTVSLVAPARH